MPTAETLAYFIEEDALRGAILNWPAGICVVLCLDETGTCELLVHHREERDHVLTKVADVLGRPLGQFQVAPERRGYPTRKLLFSEEQQLMGLLDEAENLLEVASDYAINYSFAKEEGLDPDSFTGNKPLDPHQRPMWSAGARVKVVTGHGPEVDDALLEAYEAAAAELGVAPDLLRLDDGEEDVAAPDAPPPALLEPHLPAGYAPVQDPSRQECVFAQARLQCGAGAVHLSLIPEEGALRQPAQQVHIAEVGLRDDFDRFVLPRQALEHWRPGEGASLLIDARAFPEALLARWTELPLEAQVTVTMQGIFVTPGDVASDAFGYGAEPAAWEAADAPAASGRSWLAGRTKLVLASAAALSLGSATLLAALMPPEPALAPEATPQLTQAPAAVNAAATGPLQTAGAEPQLANAVEEDDTVEPALNMLEAFAKAREGGGG